MVLAESVVILDDILPCPVSVVGVADGCLSVDLRSGHRVASVVCSVERIPVVVSELRPYGKSFHRKIDIDVTVHQHVPSCILLVGIDILHRVREVAVVHRLFIVSASLVIHYTIRTLLDGMLEVRSDSAALPVDILCSETYLQPFVDGLSDRGEHVHTLIVGVVYDARVVKV